MDKELDIPMNVLWFVVHVGLVGFGISFLLDRFIMELEGYQWFLAPAGTATRWLYDFRTDPWTKGEE